MIRYLLENTGQIRSTLTGNIELLDLNTPTDVPYIDTSDARSITSYWDFDLHEFVDIGEPPSPHHTFNYAFKQWADTRPLSDIKTQAWKQLKQQRDSDEFGGFVFDGATYDSDQVAQSRILGAAMSEQPQIWTLADNSAVPLTAAQMRQLYAALQQHVAAAHARGRAARQSLDDATTVQEINSIMY